MPSNTSNFDDEVCEFFRTELEDLGTGTIEFGLEAILLKDVGAMVSEGITLEMRDGVAAAGLAAADAIAIVLGHPREGERSCVHALFAPYEKEMKAMDGLADLGDQVLALLADVEKPQFKLCKGIQASQAEFQIAVAEVKTRIAQAKADFPGVWALQGTEASEIKFAMNSTDEDGA